MNKRLVLTAYAGLLGSLLLYAGDMLLYFTDKAFIDADKELLPSMGDISLVRLISGGLLGPIAAFLCIGGFYHLYLRVHKQSTKMGLGMFFTLSLGMIIGGAYHSFFPSFGITSAAGHPEIITDLLSYSVWLWLFSFSLMGVGWILFIILVVKRRTSFSSWIVLTTPLSTIWLIYIWELLPCPFEILVAGGWFSLMYTFMFLTSLFTLNN